MDKSELFRKETEKVVPPDFELAWQKKEEPEPVKVEAPKVEPVKPASKPINASKPRPRK